MRLKLCLALTLVLMLFAVVPVEAGGYNSSNFVVLSNGQIVVLPTNNDYFGNSFFHFQASNRVFVDSGFHSSVNVLDFRRPIIRPRPTITVLPNGTTIVRPR